MEALELARWQFAIVTVWMQHPVGDDHARRFDDVVELRTGVLQPAT